MTFDSIEEILQYAIDKEQEAADFYEQASTEETMSGNREMLREFAGEERKHRDLLEKLRRGGVVDGVAGYPFKWIPDIKRSNYAVDLTHTPNMAYKDILMLAMKREEKALRLYNDLQAMAEDDHSRALFKMLCQEEAKHKLALETLYDDFMREMGD